jgi:hypothetical protein
VVELPLAVVEVQGREHHVGNGGIVLQASRPELARALDVGALLGEDRLRHAVPRTCGLGRVDLLDPAAELRDRRARLLGALEREQREDPRLHRVDRVRVELEHARGVRERGLGILAPVGEGIGTSEQRLDVLRLLLEHLVGRDHRLVVVGAHQRGVGELQGRLDRPVGILHRLAQRPGRERRALGGDQRACVEVVDLGIVGFLAQQNAQRLDRLVVLTALLLRADRVERFAGAAAERREQRGGEQPRAEDGRSLGGMKRHGRGV